MSYKNDWQAVIGLEIHIQLNTRSKLFSTAPNRFGDEPNTNITDVCTGQPGTLPVLNQEAVKKAVQFGCAIEAHISRFSQFDRKSYFYPDSPRNYQITQFEHPIVLGGIVRTKLDGNVKEFQVNRAHLEDDAGMLKHFSTFGGVDYNRAGVPLIEVVSEPCIHSAQEAVAYAMAIKSIMESLDASDCNMEEGSLRMDANISVRPQHETSLRPKIEIKNMNSFSNMEMAIEAEIARQITLYTHPDNLHSHKPFEEIISPGTYRFDTEKRSTVLMRSKETADDYRYFPEPDLLPLVLSQEFIDEVRRSLPELPEKRLDRYLNVLGLSEATAISLIQDKLLCHYFEEGLHTCKNARALANWILVEFVGRIKESGKNLREFGLRSEEIADLVNRIEEGSITGKIAKSVADDMVANPLLCCEEIIRNNPNYRPLKDVSSLEILIDQVLSENPQSITDFKAGRTKAFSFLIGQIMKASQGTASPDLVNELLKKKLL